MQPAAGADLVLTKHEGAGNDFLVYLDLGERWPLTGALARALCDRTHGVGADGLIRVGAGRDGADLSMALRNADGSVAEMSGNGMRCLAQAAVEAGVTEGTAFTVATLGGVRGVVYRPGDEPGTGSASVEMGAVTLGEELAVAPFGVRARRAVIGNPHLVLLCATDPATLGGEVAEVGRRLQGEFDGGINVEFVAVDPVGDLLDLRVFERGVGETEACGTGSCAAAVVARAWGLVSGNRLGVRNPGGVLDVELGDTDDDPVVLRGPVTRVGEFEVHSEELERIGAGDPGAGAAAGVR